MLEIGNWVRRRPEPYTGVGASKWHLVESVIAGDAITRCGRRMVNEPLRQGSLEVSEVEPLTRMIDQPQNCKRCSR